MDNVTEEDSGDSINTSAGIDIPTTPLGNVQKRKILKYKDLWK